MVVVPACVAGLSPARPQDPGTLDEKQMPPLAHPDSPSTPAKELFARKTKPVPLAARSIGFYSHGRLAGAVALPIDGPPGRSCGCHASALGPPRLDPVPRELGAKARYLAPSPA